MGAVSTDDGVFDTSSLMGGAASVAGAGGLAAVTSAGLFSAGGGDWEVPHPASARTEHVAARNLVMVIVYLRTGRKAHSKAGSGSVRPRVGRDALGTLKSGHDML